MAMEDCKSVILMLQGEENLVAAAQQIARALGTKKNFTDEERKILADLVAQLSSISLNESKSEEVSEIDEQISEEVSKFDEQINEEVSEIEKRLNLVQEKVMSWETEQSMIWDSGPEEASEYLNAVDEARKLTGSLESSSLDEGGEDNKLFRRAHHVLQMGMARLEKEFRHMLIHNRQPIMPDHVSFSSCEEAVGDVGSIISSEDELRWDSIQSDSISAFSEGYILDVVHSDVISDLKSIANLMFISNYDQECSQAYICVRKDALDECLFILGLQKLNTEDVLKMEWASLNLKIKRWIRAMKIFVRVYLASEKWLSDQIFGELGSVSSVCFVEASKVSILQLLNFGEVIAVCHPQYEKLFQILNLYEVLTKDLPDIYALFPDEVGGSVRMECHEVLRRLGKSVKATFLEFANMVASNASTHPFPGGGIHHLTRYVMNYVRILTDYSDTLNFLLTDHDREDAILSSSPDMSPHMEEESSSSISISASPSCIVSPMAVHFRSIVAILECNLEDKSKLYRDAALKHLFRSIVAILECNLEDKSKLYRDAALQHLFLMNNISYMAQKVKGSELEMVLGDGWIRKHNRKSQQHAMNYERATWSSILSLLKDEGIRHPGSHSVSKTLLKERLRNFNVAFNEVYKTQTAWVIPDPQLREDLRISTSLKVLQAYRTFVGRHTNDIGDKYIKYTADDIETYLFDLFEGYPRILQNRHRR